MWMEYVDPWRTLVNIIAEKRRVEVMDSTFLLYHTQPSILQKEANSDNTFYETNAAAKCEG